MAVRSLGRLTLDLIAKVGGFEQGMDKAGRNAEKNFRKMRKEAKDAGDFIGKVFGVLTAGAGLTLFIKNTIDAQNEQAQLSAVLRSTGEAAGYSQKQLNDMSDSLARTSTVSAGEITNAQTTLLAFTGIVGDQFPRALQAAVDMAARTGTSVVSAAETIGRALDIPSKGLTALSKQGFRFTADQKAMAEQLEATGRTAEAQGIILEALESSYGGAAQAARDTLGGALVAVKEALNDLFEAGPGAIDPVTDSLNEFVDLLRDPGTVQAAQAMSSAVVRSFLAVTSAIAGTVNVTQFWAEELAAIRYGAAAGDIARLRTELERYQALRSEATLNPSVRVRFFSKEGLVSWLSNSDIDREIARITRQIEDSYEQYAPRITVPQLAGGLSGPALSDADISGFALLGEESRKYTDQVLKDTDEARKAWERAAEARRKYVTDELTAIQFEADTIRMTDDQIRLYRLSLNGASDDQLRLAASILEANAAFRAQRDMVEELNASLENSTAKWLSEEMKSISDDLEDRLGLSTKKTLDEMSEFSKRAAQNMQDAFADFLFNPFEDGLSGMLDNFVRILQRMAAEAAAAQIFDAIGSWGSSNKGSGGWEGAFATVAAAFAGAKDKGGYIGAGQWGLVGEYGPEIVSGPAMVTSRESTARMMGGPSIQVGQMVFPNVRNEREATEATGAAARQLSRLANSGQRYM